MKLVLRTKLQRLIRSGEDVIAFVVFYICFNICSGGTVVALHVI